MVIVFGVEDIDFREDVIDSLGLLLILLAEPIRKDEFILNLYVKVHTPRGEFLSNCLLEIRTEVL